jgi:hypothetical protein
MVSVIVKKILSGHISLPRSPVFAFGIPRPVIHNISLIQNREKRNLKFNIKREIRVVQYLLPVFSFSRAQFGVRFSISWSQPA